MRLRLLASAALLFSILIFSLSFADETLPFIGEVNSANINLRCDATATASVISVLNKGERLEVVQESYGWYKVRLPKVAPAYVKSTLVTCINYSQSQPDSNAGPCLTAKIIKDRVNIRARSDEASAILGVADENEIVSISAQDGSWYRIEPIANSFGWVHKKFVDKVNSVLAGSLNAKSIQSATLQDDNVVLTGVIKPYGVVFGRSATHKLITQDDKIYLLKGNRASLNSLNDQRVRVIGKKLKLPKAKIPVVEVKIIEVLS